MRPGRGLPPHRTAWLPKRDPSAAAAALRELEDAANTRHVVPFALLLAHARQGNVQRALDWLEHMTGKHAVWLITAKVNPLFDSLRSEPSFQSVLKRLGLAAGASRSE